MASSAETPQPHLATFKDLIALPEEERFHEILDGELVRKCMASGEHALGQIQAAIWLGSRFARRPNGADRPGGWWFLTEVEIELARHEIVRPDLAGWRRDRVKEAPQGHPLHIRPDWICEVLTSSDGRRRDGLQKRRIYANHGVPHYWLVDTERKRLLVLRLEDQGFIEVLDAGRSERVRAEPFAQLEFPVGVLFGDDLE